MAQPSRSERGSINRRVTLAVMLTSGLSLFGACAAFLIFDAITLRQSMTRQVSVLAEVIGVNSAVALSFDDSRAATETLRALSASKHVIAAVIYDGDGVEFASFVAPSESDEAFVTPQVRSRNQTFKNGYLDSFEMIYAGTEAVGTIFIRRDTQEIAYRIQYYSVIVLALLCAMCALALTLAARLQQKISAPISELARATEEIADGNLSTQVVVPTENEIGALAQTFNDMAINLRGLVEEVGQSSADVSVVARLLQESAGSMSSEAQRQKAAVSETSSSIRQVSDSIREVNANVEQLALTAFETSSSIVEMDASISEVAGHMDVLGESIETTSSGVNQVTINTDQVVKAVANLLVATDGTVGHLQQLAVSVQEVRTNAEHSHSFSEDSGQEASRGMTAVSETMAAMHEISTSFGQLQGSVSRLDEKSAAIEEIIKVIGDVAEQTSLLSLNAAIIAAQAGEQGRAFSVVAGEVSSVADRTHRSTREIAKLIRAVQGETALAVEAVNEGSEKVERGVQRSNLAGKILNQIIEKAQNSTERAKEIVEATARQSGDLSRVDHAINEVKKIVELISHSTRDQHTATAEIASAIERIRSLGLGVRHSTDEQREGSLLITDAMASVTTMINQIAFATQAQATSSEVIEETLTVFRDISDETSRRAEGMATMVTTLSERSANLERKIGRFKIE